MAPFDRRVFLAIMPPLLGDFLLDTLANLDILFALFDDVDDVPALLLATTPASLLVFVRTAPAVDFLLLPFPSLLAP